MNLSDLRNAEDLLMLLSQTTDYHNPFGLTGFSPYEVQLENWLNELDSRGLIEAASTDPPLIRLNQAGRETAFRLSLSVLPDLDDDQFFTCVVALCRRRETKMQVKIANELRRPPTNGAVISGVTA